MSPRLSHKKTRTGCKRCKARKVKCDEEKPRCGACARHSVPCEYGPSPYGDPNSPSQLASGHALAEHARELRLMHEWMAYVCYSLSTAWQFWKYQAPVLAFQDRHVLDALLALSALHASRVGPRQWSALHGEMLTVRNGELSAVTSPSTRPTADKEWKLASPTKQSLEDQPQPDCLVPDTPDPNGDMLDVSRKYFARALEGHQRSVAGLNASNYRATYLSSLLVCYYSLFTLAEGPDDPDSLMLDPMKWFRLSRGTTLIIEKWRREVGDRWFVEAGGMYGEPDLSDENELFHPDHRETFKYLLAPVQGDVILDEDHEAYHHTLSYIGLIYKGIVQGLDTPLAIGRRVIAMPARVPPRFTDLIEANQPRALAMLAHAFAALKLAEDKYPWFRGVAERQVPAVCRALPESWLTTVQWPLEMMKSGRSSLTS